MPSGSGRTGAWRAPRRHLGHGLVPLMRVAQVIAGGMHGGAEAFYVRLVLALHRAGLDQRAFVRRGRPWAGALTAAGVPPVELGFGGPLDLASRSRFRREIARFEPDLVLSWMGRATQFAASPAGRRRYVHAARLGGYYKLARFKGCDHLIGNTPDIVRYIVESGWPEARAHYLPNFVDAVPAVPPAPVDRALLDTPADAPVLLAMGRLHPNKGFDVLIRALAMLPGAILWLAGAGPLRQYLRELAAREGVADRVRFIGWRDDGAALRAAADILVCPSRIEPLGNVVIEGWASGVPVIAASSAGPAALIEDGVTGALVPVDDADALAGAAQRLLADQPLRAGLAKSGKAAYEAEFTEAKVVARYLEFFERVTG